MNQQELVSIVIPTRNSSKYLEVVLESIRNQTYRNIEIIVVDNNSTDNTKEIARKYTDKVYNKGPERSSQKNFGAKMAKGKYILFLDSDCELTKNVVAECVDLCEKKYDGIMIPMEHKTSGFWGMSKKLERKCYIGDDDLEAPWFLKRSIFFKVNGFDENLIAAEDWDLARKLKEKGYCLGRNKSYMYHNLGKLDFFREIRKKYYYGKNFINYLNKRPKGISKQLPFFRKAYLKKWKLLLSHPLYTFGFMFLKLCESIAVLAGILTAEKNIIKNKLTRYGKKY